MTGSISSRNPEEAIRSGSAADLEPVWRKSQLSGEYLFRRSSIEIAQAHSESEEGGKTYMYLFCKEDEDYDFAGACPAREMTEFFKGRRLNITGV